MVTKKNTNPAKPAASSVKKTAPRQRSVAEGDIPPNLSKQGIEGFAVSAAINGAQESKIGAMRDVIAGMPLDESVAMLRGLLKQQGVKGSSRT